VGDSIHGEDRLASLVDVAIIVFESIGLVISYGEHGLGLLEFYTELSNILLLVSCIVSLVSRLIARRRGGGIPHAVWVLRFVATACVTLTFVTVVAVLAPMMSRDGIMSGYVAMLLMGSMLYMHLICPLLAIFSFVRLEPRDDARGHETLVAIAPTVVYAIVTVTLNLLRVIEGPYPFLRVYEQPVWASVLWLVVMVAAAWGIAVLVRRLNDRFSKDGLVSAGRGD
jgi:hypothetical protein